MTKNNKKTKQMNKKAKSKFFLITLIVLGILLMILSGVLIVIFFEPLSISKSNVYSTTFSLVNQDEKSITYKFSFVAEPASQYGDCDERTAESFTVYALSTQGQATLPIYPDGIDENTIGETTDVTFDGILATARPCSDKAGGATILLNNSIAKCKIYSGGNFDNSKRARMDCTFYGDVYTLQNGKPIGAKIYGLSSGEAIVTFPKTGYNQIVQPIESSPIQEIPITDISIPSTPSESVLPATIHSNENTNVVSGTEVSSPTTTTNEGFFSKIINWFKNIFSNWKFF